MTDLAGDPVDVCVFLYTLDGWHRPQVHVGSDGSYSVSERPGAYKVAFGECEDDYPKYRFLTRWYKDSESFEAARVLVLEPGSVSSGIDARLARGGSISGRVTDASGTPVYGISVAAFDERGKHVFSGGSVADGEYVIPLLETGSYRLRFQMTNWNPYMDYEYLTQWFSEKDDFAHADGVQVVVSQNTPGIDVRLVRSACGADDDGDSLTDCYEHQYTRTDAGVRDTDGDAFGDGFEDNYLKYLGEHPDSPCNGRQWYRSDPLDPAYTPASPYLNVYEVTRTYLRGKRPPAPGPATICG